MEIFIYFMFGLFILKTIINFGFCIGWIEDIGINLAGNLSRVIINLLFVFWSWYLLWG